MGEMEGCWKSIIFVVFPFEARFEDLYIFFDQFGPFHVLTVDPVCSCTRCICALSRWQSPTKPLGAGTTLV